MDKKTIYLLLSVASAALAVAGLIFLAIQIFGNEPGNDMLGLALLSVMLSNTFNIIRGQFKSRMEVE